MSFPASRGTHCHCGATKLANLQRFQVLNIIQRNKIMYFSYFTLQYSCNTQNVTFSSKICVHKNYLKFPVNGAWR